MTSYATDGKCHNANRGTFNHECEQPAQWLGSQANGSMSGFCDDCKAHGDEARYIVAWQRIDEHLVD